MKHLLLFCSILTTLFEIIGNGTVAVAKTPLRVMSSNIRFNSEQDLGDTSWDARKQPYVNMIRDTKPDVIGMQSVCYQNMTGFAYYLITKLRANKRPVA